MIAPIFIRSETISLKRNSKKTASVIFGKKVACNYCIEKTSRHSRVIIALKKPQGAQALICVSVVYFSVYLF